MSRRYARSGNTDEALTTPAADCRQLLSVPGGGLRLNRTYWAKAIWIYNSHATQTAVVQVYDQAEGAAVAANERLAFPVPPATLEVVEIPSPGLEFKTDITAAVTNGTVAIYQAGASGYEEG